MKFVKVKKLPEPKHKKIEYHDYEEDLTRFMKMGVNCARVVLSDGEYKNTAYARSSLYRAIKTFAFPIDVHMINDEIYLTRRDI